MKKTLLRLHRWVSLCLVAFWALQIATGIMLVFHWEADAYLAGRASAPFDRVAIEARITDLQAQVPGRKISSIWTADGSSRQFDIYVREPGAPAVDKWRVDGGGDVLRIQKAGSVWQDGAVFGLLTGLHTELLAGPAGHLTVGISGMFLLGTLVMGGILAWPRRGQWRVLIRWPGSGPAAAQAYAWHRGLGLWLLAPALLVVTFGVLLSFEKQVTAFVIHDTPAPAALTGEDPEEAVHDKTIGPAGAIEAAVTLYPEATLTALRMPNDTRVDYQVLLRQPRELNRIYGETEILVSPHSGEARLVSDPFDQRPGQAFTSALFPIHTGQIGGLAGRLLVMATGCGLFVLMLFGILLFMGRLSRRRRRAA